MQYFIHEGLRLAYRDILPPYAMSGEGEKNPQDYPVVLLIHGFASNIEVNWAFPGWLKILTEADYRVVAIENRGHGASDKPYEMEAYHTHRMVADALALLDHIGVESAFVMGYSMGARIAAHIAFLAPERVLGLVLGGLGIHLVDGVGLPLGIAEALERKDPENIINPVQKMFRQFAEKNKQDLTALAACIRGSRQAMRKDEVAKIETPTLIAVGTRDPIAGAPEPLAALMPHARAFPILNRDHNLAVGDRSHRLEVVAFLKECEKT